MGKRATHKGEWHRIVRPTTASPPLDLDLNLYWLGCSCTWRTGNYRFSSDALVEYSEHLDDVLVSA